jgi:hypothetical protein
MDCSVLVFSAFGLMEFIGEGCGLLRNGLLSSGRESIETSVFFWGGACDIRVYTRANAQNGTAQYFGGKENRIALMLGVVREQASCCGVNLAVAGLGWGRVWFLDHRVVRGKKLRTNEQILNELLLNELQRRS